MSKEIAIQANNITKMFQLKQGNKVTVLNGASISAFYGEFISILGVSGSGKSTLLNCISSLSEPTIGTVIINGENPYNLNNRQLAKFRRESIAFIFQSYNLVPALPVYENIALPLRLSGKKVDKEKILNLLEELRFKADVSDMVGNLSGGEQQKVAIARAILSDSKIIFADEPTGAVDSLSRQKIFDLLKNLSKQGACVVMVTHDIELASQTDRSLILRDGRVDAELICPKAEELYQAIETSSEKG